MNEKTLEFQNSGNRILYKKETKAAVVQTFDQLQGKIR